MDNRSNSLICSVTWTVLNTNGSCRIWNSDEWIDSVQALAEDRESWAELFSGTAHLGEDVSDRVRLSLAMTLTRRLSKDFDKPLAGEYKAVFYSSDGENSATFNVTTGNAPDFHDKPHIVQRDNGNVIVIKVRAKSHLEMKAEWFKDDKPVKYSDRIKSVVKKDDKDKDGFQFLLEIYGPQKEDEAKYKCVVKNAEGQNQQSLNLVFD
ncbi:hypothetical protein RB195_023491 [Necator americanus]|uniref:Ig-like domain-containing protein n=1 Tax=Necator americanus TaxID=51031 RepID=A0ABR1EJH5_NECAM